MKNNKCKQMTGEVTREQTFIVDDQFDGFDLFDDIGRTFERFKSSRLVVFADPIDEIFLLVNHLASRYRDGFDKVFFARRFNVIQEIIGGNEYKTDEFIEYIHNLEDEDEQIQIIIYESIASIEFNKLLEMIRKCQLRKYVTFWLIGDESLLGRLNQADIDADSVNLKPIGTTNFYHLEAVHNDGSFMATMQFFVRPKRLFLLKNPATISMNGLLESLKTHLENDEIYEAYTELKCAAHYSLIIDRVALFMPSLITLIRHYIDPIHYMHTYSYDIDQWLALMRYYFVRDTLINPGEFANGYITKRLPSLVMLWKMDKQLIKENHFWKQHYNPDINEKKSEKDLKEFIDFACRETGNNLVDRKPDDDVYSKIYHVKPYLLPYDSHLELIVPGIYKYMLTPLDHYCPARDYQSMKVNVVFAKLPALQDAAVGGQITEGEQMSHFLSMESFFEYISNTSFPKDRINKLIATLRAGQMLTDEMRGLLTTSRITYNEIKLLDRVKVLLDEREIQTITTDVSRTLWLLITVTNFKRFSESYWLKHHN